LASFLPSVFSEIVKVAARSSHCAKMNSPSAECEPSYFNSASGISGELGQMAQQAGLERAIAVNGN
jgi:hypothetical protein